MAQSNVVSSSPSPRITLKPASGSQTRQAIRPPHGSTMPSPMDEEEEDEVVEMSEEGEEEFPIPGPQRSPSNRMTKNGVPDRRFKGQRDLPDEEVTNPDYRKASVGEITEKGIHLTIDGKPDRRFLENRTISEEDAELRMAEYILSKHRGKKQAQH